MEKIKKTDRLIVMDKVYALADRSIRFAIFLTIARKYGYHCIYIFHIILPEIKLKKNYIANDYF